ncbi:MAG: glycosyltransferase family 2 protein [Verrucomicrobia bacterium]|nr:glycosyltransferase family 2 protein [Verrucomicrobiota bacterium]MCH8511987.1 glycosyltransferase family 2 protein [Kiritimatiellia bacterium]
MVVEHSNAKVAVIILHYDRSELASECMESLTHQTHTIDRLVLVDNGSGDCLAPATEKCGFQTHILRLEENRGFSGGVNAGLRFLLQQGGFEYFWLLNNDTLCDPDVLENLVKMLDAHPKMGAVAGKLEERQSDGTCTYITGGKFPYPALIPFVAHPGDPVDYLCGACLLIRGEALEQVGLLDEKYFFFFEDVDWCFRARRNAWTLGVSEKALVRHRRSSTIGSMHRLRAAYYRRSYIRFLRNYSRAPFLLALVTTVFRLCVDGLGRRWEACAGTWDGWRQGWAEGKR